MTEAYASIPRRRNAGVGLGHRRNSSSDAQPANLGAEQQAELLGQAQDAPDDDHDAPPSKKGRPIFRYWCYAFHTLLVALHVVLVAMLVTHPERRFIVSITNTTATIALKACLQAFYTIYTAILVWMVQRLAIASSMSQTRKLTAVHDISGAWNGIGAAIYVLWQQTKVVSAPSTIFLTLAYLGAISGLHIVSSSVIQFEAFNNTVTTVVPSTLAWPSPSVNLSEMTWGSVSRLLTLWPLLPTAKGLSGNILYDVPSSGSIYTGAVVNVTNVTADCGLLPKVSGAWDASHAHYTVNITGLGEVALSASGLENLVSFLEFGYSNYTNSDYIGYKLSVGLELGNVTDQVMQITTPSVNEQSILGNTSITSYYVACTLDATTSSIYLPMQNGRTTQNASALSDSNPDSWTVWSPNPTTELTQIFNAAQNGYLSQTVFSVPPLYCEHIVTPTGVPECAFVSIATVYINNLLGIPWVFGEYETQNVSPATVSHNQLENAVSQLGATFIWLAGAAGTGSGGFQQAQGESVITDTILQLRLNVSIVPVIVGLVASVILSAIAIKICHGSSPTHSKVSVTNSGVLELVWISAHSKALQDLMKRVGSSLPDQLRLEGTKAEVCLADLASSNYCQDEDTDIQPQSKLYAPHWQEFAQGKFFLHCLCYVLHAILLALHVVLIILLMHHPEHHVTMESDNPLVTTALSIALQAFYTLYTAGLVFVTQELALSALITHQHYLTAIHDISQAWTSIGAALSALWQQTKIMSSIWTLLGVTIYLACVSVLHITSTAIMEFTPFNSTSTISVQSTVTWPNSSVLTNGTWAGPNQIVPPNALLANMEAVGLQNNTIYDIVTTTNPTFTAAVVNSTSLTASCGLIPNLTYSNLNGTHTLNFTADGLGFWSFLFDLQSFKRARNQIVYFSLNPSLPNTGLCPSCDQYLFFLITTDVELDQSISGNMAGLSVNIAETGSPSIVAYLAACSLVPQAGFATLDLLTSTLMPGPIQPTSQSWKLWTPVTSGPSNLTADVGFVYANSIFGICPQNGFTGCSMISNASLPPQNSSLYTLTPTQLQQGIEQSVATMIWIGGQLGPSQGGFERTLGESQVTQVTTKWRLHINKVPVILVSAASLVLFIMVTWFTGVPSRMLRPSASITGISVLETFWVAGHSQTLHEHMGEIENPLISNLRKAGMFQICLGDIHGVQAIVSESEPFLE